MRGLGIGLLRGWPGLDLRRGSCSAGALQLPHGRLSERQTSHHVKSPHSRPAPQFQRRAVSGSLRTSTHPENKANMVNVYSLFNVILFSNLLYTLSKFWVEHSLTGIDSWQIDKLPRHAESPLCANTSVSAYPERQTEKFLKLKSKAS